MATMKKRTNPENMAPLLNPRSLALAVSAAFFLPSAVFAQTPPPPAPNTLPTNGQFVQGTGNIRPATPQNYLEVQQQSQKGVINWGSFSIGSASHVHFQHDAGRAGMTLNRVVGQEMSQIAGRMTSDGSIFLVNNAGVLFHRGATVDVGSLFVSSLSIRDQDFMAGRYQFYRDGRAGEVANEGTIITANGYAALSGPQVRNDGLIIARSGSVALAAGDRVTLDIVGDGLISISVDQAALNASLVNSGRIEADGGTVLLTARSANALLDTVINTTGLIRATSLVERNGQIALDGGDAGLVQVAGTLSVSGVAAGSTGGTVQVLGEHVALRTGARVDASGDAGGGTVLVGGDFQGKNPDVRNAKTTTVEKDARINADAVNSGNGGKVIVWSDVVTQFHGHISARGGILSGNGGFAEISGKQHLEMPRIKGHVDLRAQAPGGKGGQLLLDPNEIDVNAGAPDGDPDLGNPTSAASTVTANGGTSTAILASDIEEVLADGVSVTLQTTHHIDGNDNIRINTALDTGLATGGAILTLDANDLITGRANLAGNNYIALLKVDLVGPVSKVYDANTTATLAPANYVVRGRFDTDAISITQTVGAYASKNVADNGGTGAVSTALVAGDYTNTNGNNYQFALAANGNVGTITPAAIANVTGITANNKVYDTATTATLNTGAAAFTGILGADVLAVGAATGNFTDKNVANGKTVNITGITLGGADAGNYTLTSNIAATTADITPASIANVTGITANNKVYDTTTAATLNTGAASFTGILGADVLTVATSTGAFADKNVGTGKTVNVTGITLGGADAGNYTLTSNVATTTANITAASVTISGLTANNKVYDTTTAATLSGTATAAGVIGADVVTVGGTATSGTFNNKNVGAAKPVTADLSGLSLGGADGGNYVFTTVTTPLTADVTPAAIANVTGITANNKVYDATTAATLNTGGASFTNILAGDVLTVAAATGTFGDKNVGTGKAVGITGITLGGADAGNYTLTSNVAATTANITAASLTISGLTANNKVYDTTTAATLGGAATTAGVIGADVVTLGGTATNGTFNNKNAAVAKPVTADLSGLTLGGADGGNYVITTVTTPLTADVTPAAIANVTGITANNKVYDSTMAATLNTGAASFTNILAGDVLTVAAATGTFGDKNVGTGKPVGITGITLGGADAGNYTLTSNVAAATADITAAALTISGITAANKVYDTTTAATVNTAGAVFTGLLGGDVVTVSATGTFADKNVGTGKTVTLSNTNGGADAGNYTITNQLTTTADITQAALTISGITAANKVYDTTTAATVNTAGAVFTGLLGADVVTVSATGTFGDKNVGVGKTVTLSSTNGGADAGNYAITNQANTTANITPAAIANVTGITANNKVYDTTTAATLNTGAASFTGILGADVLTVATSTGTFADKNVANGKAVSITGITLGGADAGNYTLTSNIAASTANITPAAIANVTGITANNRVYNATTAATLNTGAASFTGILGGDVLNVATATGAFADKNAGVGKAVNVTGITLGGADAGNYTLTSNVAATTANITPAAIANVTGITGNNRVYDATTAATLNTGAATFTGMFGGDNLTVATSAATFADKNVGNGKAVSVTGITLGGADAGNYTLTSNVAATTANITQLASVTWTGAGGNLLWSNAANWAGNVIPDLGNVASVNLNGANVTANLANVQTTGVTNGSLNLAATGTFTGPSFNASVTNFSQVAGSSITTPGSISIIASGILTPGNITSTAGSVTLGAATIAPSIGGTAVTAQSGSFSSNTDVAGLNVSLNGVPLAVSGTAMQWSLTGAVSAPSPVTVPNPDVVVLYNGFTLVASVQQQQAANTIASISASVTSAITEEANKTFGTDSVAEQVDYGFAGDVGATPPMDHRIDESGISLPSCVQEAREGVACK